MDAFDIRCGKCGRYVAIDPGAFTSSCDCGTDYNWNGTLLAPRSQWGEETGESLADIMMPMSDDDWEVES